MNDRIYDAFLRRQYEDGMALANGSDLLELYPVAGWPPSRYVARFFCKGLVRAGGGAVAEADCFEVGIWFPSDYLRRAEPFQVLTWMWPPHVFHPNISDTGPFICVGKLTPETSLVDLLFQVFEIITYQKFRTDDAMNGTAAHWAIQEENRRRLPVDGRPLKRRTLKLELDAVTNGEDR